MNCPPGKGAVNPLRKVVIEFAAEPGNATMEDCVSG